MKAELKLTTLTPEVIAQVSGGELRVFGKGADGPVTCVGHDSREACPGMLFFAIVGERLDGHVFIKNALEAGARVIMCERVPEDVCEGYDFCAIVVDNTVYGMGALASYYRSLLDGVKVIAITGSVGKTTTKEMISSVASASFRTHKTRGNYNNEIGLPLTLFLLEPDVEVIVLEMGMSNLGEIEHMSNIAKPDICVITNIGSSHMESLGSRENISRAKLEIASGLAPDGKIIMNGDEPLLFKHKDEFGDRALWFGFTNRDNNFRAMNVRLTESDIVFDMVYGDYAVTNVEVPALGKHNVNNALVAYAVGTVLGMSEEKIREGLGNFVGEHNRQNIYPVGDITVIDDCYNASPESMRAAIDVLTSVAAARGAVPTALLGDMLELGETSALLHDQIGRYAAGAKVAKLYCYGDMADIIAEAAIKNGIRAENVYVCKNSEAPDDMAELISGAAKPGDVLLVKASRGVRAELVIEALKKRFNEN